MLNIPELNIHALLPCSRSNGPGKRFVIWVQGCRKNCPGCFNPDTHSITPRQLISVDHLWERIQLHIRSIEGISISGGEPLDQAPALSAFLHLVRNQSPLSVVLFSGYYLNEIESLPHGHEILSLIDILIDGPYVSELRYGKQLRGSTNQQIHFLTNRYSRQDLDHIPDIEVIISPSGEIMKSGLGVIA